jgi:hypothetical protein
MTFTELFGEHGSCILSTDEELTVGQTLERVDVRLNGSFESVQYTFVVVRVATEAEYIEQFGPNPAPPVRSYKNFYEIRTD